MNVLLSTKPNSAWALQGVIRSRSNGAQAFERREKQQVSVAAPSERVRVILFESSFLRVLCFRKRGKQTHFPERKEWTILNIQPVTTADDLRRFIRFPYTLYRGDPNWVPWLKSEQKALFNPRKNAMLGHCEYALFLLCDDNKVIGRIAAFYDKQAISY